MRGKQVEWRGAVRAVGLHDPKVVEDFAGVAARIGGSIEVADRLFDVRRQFLERSHDPATLQLPQCGPHRARRDGIDVAAERGHAKLVRLADRRARAHKWVEDGNGAKGVGKVERRGQIRLRRKHGAEQESAENGAKPLRPPLVNVVDGAMDLLPPALSLGQSGEELEGEDIRLDQPDISRFRRRIRHRRPRPFRRRASSLRRRPWEHPPRAKQ